MSVECNTAEDHKEDLTESWCTLQSYRWNSSCSEKNRGLSRIFTSDIWTKEKEQENVWRQEVDILYVRLFTVPSKQIHLHMSKSSMFRWRTGMNLHLLVESKITDQANKIHVIMQCKKQIVSCLVFLGISVHIKVSSIPGMPDVSFVQNIATFT